MPLHPKELYKKFDQQRQQLKDLLPDFLALYADQSSQPFVQMFTGVHAAREVFEDILAVTKKEYCYLSPIGVALCRMLAKSQEYWYTFICMKQVLNKQPVALYYLGGSQQTFKQPRAFYEWCAGFPELQMIADVTPQFIANNPQQHGWLPVIRAVKRMQREWNRYHGFIITLPPERFLYLANLFSFMLGIVGKPVVFTTSFIQSAQSSEGNKTQRYTDVDLQ
ncbi:MAG TPA: asparaginase domain-containing protein, partial [Patescibacteria group bacterium]|nr:asparaginase domain-containing protein [Patescibacteria group bacterium]